MKYWSNSTYNHQQKQGILPCFSFMKISVIFRGIFFLFVTQHSFSTETYLGVAARQEACLQQIISSEDISDFDRSVAQCITEEKLETANRSLALVEDNQLNLARCAVLLRMLILTKDTGIITPATRITLENTLSEFIKSSLPQLSFQSDEMIEPESLQLAKPMIILLWCQYTEVSDLRYDWFTPESRNIRKTNLMKQLNDKIDQWLKTGFLFRGSHEYTVIITSLINLHDLIPDESLQIKTAALTDILLGETALETIDGNWGGTRQNTQTLLSSSSVQWLSYLLFGTPKPEDIQGIDPSILILCSTGYRPPPLIEKLGKEKEHRGIYELKHKYNTYTQSLEQTEEVRKYSYVTPQYILSSFQLNQQTVPWQARPWDLMVSSEDKHTTHVMSFAGKQFFSGKDVMNPDEFDVWNATMLQYKNVLFCQYQKCSHMKVLPELEKEFFIPNFAQLPSRIWIPNTLAPIEQDKGWRFINTGTVFIAIRPVPGDSYWWRTAEAGENGEETASILGCRDLYAGMLVEVETESSRVSSYNQFKQQVLDAPLLIDDDSVTFVSRRGDVFYFPRKGGEFLVNGIKIDAQNDSKYDYFSNPFIQSKWDSGIFDAKWNALSLRIDMSDPANPIRKINTN
jgi:hypothetical protein